MKIDESISGLNIMIFVCLNSIRYFYCCYMIADCCRALTYACNSSMLSFNLNNMSKDICEFMQEAIRLSINNVEEGKGGPFGAVVVKNGTKRTAFPFFNIIYGEANCFLQIGRAHV